MLLIPSNIAQFVLSLCGVLLDKTQSGCTSLVRPRGREKRQRFETEHRHAPARAHQTHRAMVIHPVACFGTYDEYLALKAAFLKYRAEVMTRLTAIIASNDAIEDQNVRLERKFGEYEKCVDCVLHVCYRHT